MMKAIMKWQNLKSMKCPKCGDSLSPLLYCKSKTCRFHISEGKFNSMIRDMYYKPPRNQIRSEETNLSELNNLGLEPIADDFSDSNSLL